MYSDKPFRIAPFITLYSLTHLVVDASCAFLLLGLLELNNYIIMSMILYNACAFVLQAPFGFIVDKWLNPKFAAIIGLVFIAVSFLFWHTVFAALIIAGIGNALFHVAGGSLVLSLKNKKTTFSGIYVAPGGVGLSLGSFLSISQTNTNLLLFPLALMILGLILYFVKTPEFIRTNVKESIPDYRILIVVLIMIPIVVRSMIGLSLEFPWKENQYLYLLLIAAIAFGKASGGILADRYGLMKVGVGGLLVSTPLLAFFASIPVLGILGVFIFNFTMPVTLIALLSVMPKYKGLSFGLASVALCIGALPTIIGKDLWLKQDWVIFLLIVSAAMILFSGLRFTVKNLRNGL